MISKLYSLAILVTLKSFFHTLLKKKTAAEEKQWQQLPKDKMKRIWRLQWQTLGRLVVSGALIWGMVLLGYWVYNTDIKGHHVSFFLFKHFTSNDLANVSICCQ